MVKVLVTGTAGFIGFHLVNRLLKNNWAITGIDNINDYYDVSLKYARLKESGILSDDITYNIPVVSSKDSNYCFIKIDLSDKENMLRLFEREKFDYVIHLAAQAGVRYSLINPHAYIDSNITGFLNVLEACRHNPVKHLIYASSSSVYGANTKIPFEETDFVDNPVSLYAATKKANELFAHTYSHLYGIPASGLRFFTVYGPWGRPDMAYYMFTKAIIDGKPIKVFNNGKMKRDFTYIDDITSAIEKLLPQVPGQKNDGYSKAACEVYNIGNNTPVELSVFISEIEKATGKIAVKDFLPMQPGDVPVTYASINKLEKKTGNINGTDLRKGLGEFVNWYHSYYQL